MPFCEHDTVITGLSFAQALNEELQATFGKFNVDSGLAGV
jgi:hypothetical protein